MSLHFVDGGVVVTLLLVDFFKLLNVCILVLTAVIGLLFLTRGMAALNAYHAAVVAAAPAAARRPFSGAPVVGSAVLISMTWEKPRL